MRPFGRTRLGLFRVPFFTTSGEERVVEAYIHTHIYTHRHAYVSTSSRGKDRFVRHREEQDQALQSLGRTYFPKLVSHTLQTTAVNILSPTESSLNREELAVRSNGSHLHYGKHVPSIPASSHRFMGSLTPAAVATAVLHMAPAAMSTVPCQFLPRVTSLLHLTSQLVSRKGYVHVSEQGWWWDGNGSILYQPAESWLDSTQTRRAIASKNFWT